MPSPEPRSFLSHDGTRIAYTREGNGPEIPLILTDGIGCAGFIWVHLAPYLRHRRPILHWNYRGHGLSDRPADLDRLTIEDHRRDLIGLMDAEGIDRAVLLGHSMGVQVCLDAALHHPDRVAGLGLLCGSCGHMADTFHDGPYLRYALPLIKKAFTRYQWLTQPLWKRVVPTRFIREAAMVTEVNGRLLRPDQMVGYFDHLSRLDLDIFARTLDYAAQHTTEDRLGEVQAPTLIVAGEKDTFTPSWLSIRMAEQIPNAELLMVPLGTHTAPIEMPDLVNLRVEKWLWQRIDRAERRRGQQRRRGGAKRAPVEQAGRRSRR